MEEQNNINVAISNALAESLAVINFINLATRLVQWTAFPRFKVTYALGRWRTFLPILAECPLFAIADVQTGEIGMNLRAANGQERPFGRPWPASRRFLNGTDQPTNVNTPATEGAGVLPGL